jgi:hypothetical protein
MPPTQGDLPADPRVTAFFDTLLSLSPKSEQASTTATAKKGKRSNNTVPFQTVTRDQAKKLAAAMSEPPEDTDTDTDSHSNNTPIPSLPTPNPPPPQNSNITVQTTASSNIVVPETPPKSTTQPNGTGSSSTSESYPPGNQEAIAPPQAPPQTPTKTCTSRTHLTPKTPSRSLMPRQASRTSNVLPEISEDLRKALDVATKEVTDKTVKDKLVDIMTGIISKVKHHQYSDFAQAPSPHPPLPLPIGSDVTARLSYLESDIRQIKEAILSDKPKTWAQRVASTPTTTTTKEDQIKQDRDRKERLEQIRNDKAKKEVIISFQTADENTQKLIETGNPEVIKGKFQEVIDSAITPKFQIKEISKTAKYVVKIVCNTEDEATHLRKFPWEKMVAGTKQLKPTYGIVVHGAPKQDIDLNKQQEVIDIINFHNQVNPSRIIPLIKTPKNPDAPTQSIVIFFENPEQANKCIEDGVRLNYRRFPAERYIPKSQITQCFKCQGYGHKSIVCTREEKCGKCGQSHNTKACTSEVQKCVHCEGAHPAWHPECPRRQHEKSRISTASKSVPITFQC